jgi:hypothetical protein
MDFMTNNQPDCPQRRKVCRVLMLPLLAGLGMPVHAVGVDTAPALERRVKAAFLYKFLGYADFPAGSFADASTPVSIGVVGADDMAAELTRSAAGRLVTGRMITVRALREQDLAQPLHVLFVAGQDDARAARLLRAANAQLTVTECDGGLRSGSVINFTIIDDRVRFDVSLDAAEKKNVKLSSRLLTVANRVQKGAS